MKKRIMLLIFVMLFSSIMFVSAESSSPIIDIGNEITPVTQPLHLTVQHIYECTGNLITNVTYTAYTTSLIPDGSKIDFYTGNPNNVYPTTLLGSSYVKGGKAVYKTYQKIDNYYLGSAVWTKPSVQSAQIPPIRIYSNIVTYNVSLSKKIIDLNVTLRELAEKNVLYTVSIKDPITSQPIPTATAVPSDIVIDGVKMNVQFSTFKISSPIEEKLNPAEISKIADQKPYQIDFALIENWTAKANLNLPAGRYIVLAECPDLTDNCALEVFKVPQIIVIPPVTKTPILPTPPVISKPAINN